MRPTLPTASHQMLAAACDVSARSEKAESKRFLQDRASLLAIAVLLARAAAADPRGGGLPPERVCVADFESDAIGQLPTGWEAHADDATSAAPYTVQSDDGGKFLAARDHGQSVILARKSRVDLEHYPFLSFRWRVHEVPRNGDERFGPTNDSAAAIYVTYGTHFGLIPIAVKYVWSSTLPVGSALQRSGFGRPWVIVAASGTDGLGEWHTFVFDVRATYRETFGGDPPRHIEGVGILSDANATHSTAFADYDDLCFLARASTDSGIHRVLSGQ